MATTRCQNRGCVPTSGGCLPTGGVPTRGCPVTRGVTTSRGSALHPPPRIDHTNTSPGRTMRWTTPPWTDHIPQSRPWAVGWTTLPPPPTPPGTDHETRDRNWHHILPLSTEWQTFVKTLTSLAVGNNEGFETRWVLFFNINPGKAL